MRLRDILRVQELEAVRDPARDRGPRAPPEQRARGALDVVPERAVLVERARDGEVVRLGDLWGERGGKRDSVRTHVSSSTSSRSSSIMINGVQQREQELGQQEEQRQQ